jgi:hypothetical protein
VDSGVHDDAARAADAWRAAAGDTATDAPLEAVTSSGELWALAQLDLRTPFGDETRSRADDWYRAQRRGQALAAALRSTAHPLPPQRSFFDEDTTPLVEEFSEWHVARHGHAPDEELTEILAGEWQDARSSLSPCSQAHLAVGLGVRSRTAVNVFTLTAPNRVVIDVAH